MRSTCDAMRSSHGFLNAHFSFGKRFVCLCFIAAYLFSSVDGYPFAAGRCHGPWGPHGDATKLAGSGISLQVSSTAVETGQFVTVLLSGRYRGFLLKSSTKSSAWSALPLEAQRSSVCPESTPAVSHHNAAVKSDIAFQWHASVPGVNIISGFVVVSTSKWCLTLCHLCLNCSQFTL